MLAACRPFGTRADDWLRSNATTAAPEMNIAGYWASSDWGDSYFRQQGGKISGMLGSYPVRGVINQHTAYLVIYTKTQPLPHYTAMLWLQEPDVLTGRWARRRVVEDSGDGEHMLLRRVRN
jgi:hypothetical protein